MSEVGKVRKCGVKLLLSNMQIITKELKTETIKS